MKAVVPDGVSSELQESVGRIILPDPTEIEADQIAPVMAQMAALQLSLATRLVAQGAEPTQNDADSLLTVQEAAARLKCSEDWLYKRAKRLPFTVRVGRNLRFSRRGIEEAIRTGMRVA